MTDQTKIDILAVDDRDENLFALEAILESPDTNIITAKSGNEALGLMLEYDFALVLLDVQMPGMNGFETAELMRNNSRTRQIPIIFITAINKDKQNIFKAYDAGAVDYIFKPFEPEILKSKVRVFMDLYQQKNALQKITLKLENTISELIDSKSQLRKSEEKYRDIFQNANEAIFVTKDHFVLFHNERLPELTNLSPEYLKKHPITDIVHPLDKKNVNHELAQVSKQKKNNHKFTFRIINDKQEVSWFEINCVNIKWDNQPAILNFMMDISLRKAAEEEMNTARRLAEEANHAKSDFLASMSHEIRTPLNGIIGMAELVLMGEFPDEQKDRVESIRQSGESLLDILNEILDLSKIEAEKMELESIPFNLKELVEKAFRTLSIKGIDKQLDLICFVDPNIPDSIIGDPTRLRQIILNLLSNALKFTEQGEIGIYINIQNKENSTCTIKFEVNDSGIGIEEKKLENLFESFKQADKSTARKYGGTGLGLPISKKLVEMMGSKLEVKSKAGEGSSFFFSIDFDVDQSISLQNQKEIKVPKASQAILVSDSRNGLLSISKLLSFYKLENLSFTSVEPAMDAIKSKPGVFSLMIIDYQLPGEDSLKLASEVRELALSGKPTPWVIFMTHDGTIIPPEIRKEYNLKTVLTKPVYQSSIYHLLIKLYQPESQPVLNKQKSEFNELNDLKIKVLLAEDNKINAKLATSLFKLRNCSVDWKENGKLAVEAFQNNSYDIVFMDIEMPEMNGYEASNRIRKEEKKKKQKPTPIIAMSAHAMKKNIDKALESGMNDYITKPFKANEIYQCLMDYCNHKK